MSNVGQGILAVAGGIIGFYVGGPTGAAYGFQLGLAVGTVVSPTQLPGTFGPRLTDNRTTTSQLGAPVTEVFGTDAVPGVVIWLGDIVEHSTTEEVGGKGGPEGSQTTYSYTQPIAIGLARGPMGGILRIWENGKLVYDRRPIQEGESALAFANRISATDIYENTFTLYLGDEAQLPDPTIELKEGAGNVPGFRGLMYIVYHDRALRDDQARRHPNFKFEIFDFGTLDCEPYTFYSNEAIFPWSNNPADPLNCLNDHEIEVLDDGASNNLGTFSSLAAAISAIEASRGRSFDISYGYTFDTAVETITSLQGGPSAFLVDPLHIYLKRNTNDASIDEHHDGSTNFCSILNPDDRMHSVNTVFWDIGFSAVPPSPHPDFETQTYCETNPLDPTEQNVIRQSIDATIAVTRLVRPPDDPCFPRCGDPLPEYAPGYCVVGGLIVSAGPWTLDITTYHVLQRYTELPGTPSTLEKYPLNPARPTGHADDTEEFWTEAYGNAVSLGLMDAGLVYGVDYPVTKPYGYTRDGVRCTISTEGKSIADIVTTICERCGLYDTDTSDLAARFVHGYQIPRVMDGRSAINTLRSVGFFDAVESGGIVKFPTRGRASVRTLGVEDLGAHAFGSDSNAPAVTTRKQQDVELPRQMFIQYRDPARDYETGEQPSPTRLTTDAVNDVYVDVAVAISATQAAQCAEVLWADQWASRWQHNLSLDGSHVDLEPTDCILVPVDGRLERMRIQSAEDSAVILRQLQLVRDDDGAYVSEAVADPPAAPPPPMAIYSQTDLLLFDLPPLRAEDNDVGIYAAARPQATGTTWGGAQIFRALDGETFSPIASIVNEATTGTLYAPFPAGDTTVWDDVTTIEVTLESGALESRTDDAVLAGANTMAIGAHGRWEILQFANAVQTGVDTWELSRLLRGRRGTEHHMGTQQAGDTWVLVSGPGVIRLPLLNSYLDLPVSYKAVTFGASFATGIEQEFTSNGETLVPFSPVSIEGARDTSDDLTISWIRRDRLGEELPDGDVMAMSDPPESYEVDILSDDSPPSVVRTLTSSTSSVVYTAAQQGTDFGVIPDQVTVLIYQMSAVVGRGTPGAAVI